MPTSQSPDDAPITARDPSSELTNPVELLRSATVDLLVDVRRYLANGRHSHLVGLVLATTLPIPGITHQREQWLGGRRHPPGSEPRLDPWRTVESFCSYVAHTRTTRIQAALDGLLHLKASAPLAVLRSGNV